MAVSARSGLARAMEELSSLKGEPDWLRERRRQAWRTFEEMPLPDWRRSKWWRTDLSGLDLDALSPLVPLPGAYRSSEPCGAGDRGGEVGGLLVQRSSLVVSRHLRVEPAHRGVIFTDLDTAVREHPELVQEHLGTLMGPGEGKLMALHAALWSGGAFLYVPPGVEVHLPIWTTFELAASGSAVFAHSLVVAGPGSRVTFVEEHTSPARAGASPTQALATAVTEVRLGEGAWVECVALQDWADDVLHFARRRALAGADSWMRWTVASLGSRLAREELEARLEGPGASAEVRGLFFANRKRHLDLVAGVHHLAPHTASNTLVKWALAGEGQASFEGLIKVHRGAQGTNAYLADHALLLSAEAKSDSVPSLEVEANDVRASHGATVGQIDPDQLFYLMSRGLTESEAMAMIVSSFIEPVAMIVSSFIEPVAKELPLEYAVELNRLIQLEMEGAVG